MSWYSNSWCKLSLLMLSVYWPSLHTLLTSSSALFFLEDEFVVFLPLLLSGLPFPWSFLFLLLFPVSSDVWYAGFVDVIPSLSLPSGRILAFGKKSCNWIFCFFLLVSSGDDGIFLLFLELLFRWKLYYLWFFVICTHLSVCCWIGFLLPFLEFV